MGPELAFLCPNVSESGVFASENAMDTTVGSWGGKRCESGIFGAENGLETAFLGEFGEESNKGGLCSQLA